MREVKTTRKPADLALGVLADEVQAFLGRPVSLVLLTAEDGSAVIQVGPVGAERDPAPVEFDEKAFLALVDAHVLPPPAPDEVDDLDAAIAAVESATTVAQMKAALLGLLRKDRARKAPGRVTRQEVRHG